MMNTLSGDPGNGVDDVGRRSRFAVLGGMRERATSQPPRDGGGLYFAEHSLSPPGLRPSERWANSRLNRGGQGLPPTRSASFSTPDAHSTTLGTSVRSASHFPSTFEDAETPGDYDDPDGLYEHRSRGYDPSSRSRSQSLAVFSRSSSALPVPGSGMAQSWRDGTLSSSTLSSSPLAEHRFPSTRMPANMYASSPAVIPYKKQQQQQQPDISNMSPFVRDVGQIHLDDVRDVWGPQRDDERGGGGSGTTSRRHSVSVVQPRRPQGSAPFHDDDMGFSAFGSGRLMISDEDLATDLNMLNLNFHESNGRHLPGSQPASLPIYGLPNPHAPHHYHARDLSRSPERTGGRSSFRPMGIGNHPRNASFTSSHFSDIDRNSSRSPHRNESPFRTEDSFFSNGYRTSSADDGYRTVSSSYKQDHFAPLASPSATQALRHSLHHLNSSSGSEPRLSSSPTFPPNRHSLYSNSPLASPISARGLNVAPNQLPSAHQQLPIYQGRRVTEQPATSTPVGLSDLGRGVPLHSVPESCPLYIVEFKAARTDIFYCVDPSLNINIGDLVIVEADRGKDLGKVINDTITLADVEAYQKQKPVFVDPSGSPTSATMSKKEISPKRIYAKAQAQETQSLLNKIQDEQKALQLCQTKVKQKKLPMEVVDAEYQWDRRKLTFYFIADKRIDFRELVRELFRLYKTRIWMACLQGPAAAD